MQSCQSNKKSPADPHPLNCRVWHLGLNWQLDWNRLGDNNRVLLASYFHSICVMIADSECGLYLGLDRISHLTLWAVRRVGKYETVIHEVNRYNIQP